MATNSNHGKIFVIQFNWHQRSFIFVSSSSDEMLHLQLQKKQTFDAKKKNESAYKLSREDFLLRYPFLRFSMR